jgi:CheY-like chemotaxis protein
MKTKAPPIRIEFANPTVPAASSTSGGQRWTNIRSGIDLITKILPSVALVTIALLFRTEVSTFLQHTSKFEAFGLKLEKGDFEKRLFSSAKNISENVKDKSAWAEVPFRKLRLASPYLKGSRVLWVDDNPQNNFYIRRILSDFGMDVTIALNNIEALDAIRRHDFFLVISDYNRDSPSVENGGQLAESIQALGYETKFIFFTAVPGKVPHPAAEYLPDTFLTNDPSKLLGQIAELSIARGN